MMTPRGLDPEDLTDVATHARGDAHRVWRWMRSHAPLHRHPAGALPAFWSVTRYGDLRAIYSNPNTFSSAHGVLLRCARHGDDPGAGLTLALTDSPRHRQLRALVSRWFSDHHARSLADRIRAKLRRILSVVKETDRFDFVHDVAARLTLSVIADVLGFPEERHDDLFKWSYEAFDAAETLAKHTQLMQAFCELIEERMARPGDDPVGALVDANIDGEMLSEEELLLNCENLVGATENAGLSMASGMLALIERPDQWRLLSKHRELLPTAVEELLRWSSSATHSMRTVVRPCELHGQQLAPMDKVVLWIPSANFDEQQFEEPSELDIRRRPNRHLALGFGEHACIGAALARAQMKVLLTELLDSPYPLSLCGDVVPLSSIAVAGPAKMPVRFTG